MGFRRCILSFKMVDWVVYVWWRDEVLLVCFCLAIFDVCVLKTEVAISLCFPREVFYFFSLFHG